MRIRRLLAMAGAAALTVLVTGIGTAHASGYWTIQDAATSRCLDSNANGNVYTLPCNGGNYQNWDQISVGSGRVILRDMQTGLCLSVFGQGMSMAKCASNTTDTNYFWYKYTGYYGTVYKNEFWVSVLDSNAAGNVYPSPDWALSNEYQNWD